ncbi:hypothetical protein HO173_012809 [Letharia columbiana]|uniref:Uncharacterized protein n=1 Tax=Letharia columbiana TaxID=112416 RepID=A0A8H6CL99_9LECA|nr:uncharacterized protein HO173_012809 [Letharia columbiana]KAF6225324.1 hypothetical protein HO173_012809 [Letharia columbiana]
MGFMLGKRQTNTDGFVNNDNDDDDTWGYSTTGVAIKWAVVGALLILLVLWLVLGRMHAQRRMRRGQRPLIYHRILVPRPQGARFYPQPRYASHGPGWGGEGYQMQAYPPPAYNTDHVPPPVYQPPDGGSKTNPHQDWAAVPPPGPPPGHEAGESSRTVETVPLNQDEAGQENTTVQSHVQTENPGLMSRLNPFK